MSLAGCLLAAWSFAPHALAQQAIRITAGGASQNYVTASGVTWLTDRYFNGGDTTYTSNRIAGTNDSYLYATGRAGLYGDFSYHIPVASGPYQLTLKLAETQYGQRGDRIFNVVINGVLVLGNFDILAEVPAMTALDRSFPVTVTNGALDIQFIGVRHFGTISAIEITPAGTAPAPQPQPAPQPPPVTAPPVPSGGHAWFASPTGSPSGNGSEASPWDLATALGRPAAVIPGDTIWLRGGTYGNGRTIFNSRLAGTADSPVIVRQFPGERATINGGIATYSPHTWYWGFEVTNTNPDRGAGRSAPECVDTYDGSTGVKLINLVLHDCSQGIGFWLPAVDAEAYGNLIYYNGWQGPSPDRGHGHGIYAQNRDGVKRLADNIIFSQFGLGIQAYGSGATWVQNIAADGNVIFNNGAVSAGGKLVDNILFAGGAGLKNITVTNNYTYHTPAENDGYSRLGWPWSATNQDVVARDNYWIGGNSTLEIWNWNNATFTGNTLYGQSALTMSLNLLGGQSASAYHWDNNRYFGSGRFHVGSSGQTWSGWKAVTGVDVNSTYAPGAPTGVWTFVRPNKYEPGRAHIAVYNWDQKSAVDVDLSGVMRPGARYEIRDAQNFFGPAVASGTYAGGAVSVPMAGLTAAPAVGNVPAAPRHTGAEFGVFVVLSR